MEKLTFLVNWGREKEKSWSGTNYSLYKVLQQYYDIRDVNVRTPFIISVIFRILRIDWFSGGFYSDWFLKKKVKNVKLRREKTVFFWKKILSMNLQRKLCVCFMTKQYLLMSWNIANTIYRNTHGILSLRE